MLKALRMGGAQVDFDAGTGQGRLWVPATGPRHYTNAQVDDYHGFTHGRRIGPRFAGGPPARLELSARASLA